MKKLQKLTILYVEDEAKIRENYIYFLDEMCESLYIAEDGLKAYELYKKYQPHIIILDLYMPKLNGIELAKKIRGNGDYNTVLIAFTGHSERHTLLELVDLYFLSFLVKPVTRSALLDALTKASDKIYGSQYIHLPFNCSWDSKSRTLFQSNCQIDLTKRETFFMELMVQKSGVPSSAEEVLNHVWSDRYEGEVGNTSIRTLVKNLRKKLPDGLIKNQYGLGYKIDF